MTKTMNLDQLIGAAYVTQDFTFVGDDTLIECIGRIKLLGNSLPTEMLPAFQAEADKRGLLIKWDLDLSSLEPEPVAPAARPVITRTSKKLTVTLANGDTASRGTSNKYTSVVVGYDAAGKLSVLSAHWLPADALKAVSAHKAGKFVNQNYRSKLAGAPIIVNA